MLSVARTFANANASFSKGSGVSRITRRFVSAIQALRALNSFVTSSASGGSEAFRALYTIAYARASPGRIVQSTARSVAASIVYAPYTPLAGSVVLVRPFAGAATAIGWRD